MFSRTKLVVVLLSLAVRAGDATQCTRCAAGKFKSRDMIFVPYTSCPRDTFSSAPGAAQCERCPPFSAAPAGSSRCTFEPCRSHNYTAGCLCPVGASGPDGGPCTACAAGAYKNATGAAGCDNCSSTQTSAGGSGSCFCRANYITTDIGDCLPCTNGMISRENTAVCFCPNGTSLVDGRCAQIYSEGLRLSGFINIEAVSNSSNTSVSVTLDYLLQQLTSSIALQYNISESLVQVIYTSNSRKLLQESGKIDVVIMAESKADLDRIAIQTIAEPPPMIQNIQQGIGGRDQYWFQRHKGHSFRLTQHQSIVVFYR